MPPDHVLVLSEHGHEVLPGRASVEVVRRLDGSRTLDELVTDLARTLSAPEVRYLVTLLSGRGLLVDADDDDETDGAAGYWHRLQQGTRAAAARVADGGIALRMIGATAEASRLAATAIEQELGAAGVPVRDDGALLVVVADDYLAAPLADVNRAALRSGSPWLLVRPTGRTPWLGPLFVPDRTACWACLAQRLRANYQAQRFLTEHRARTVGFTTAEAATASTVAVVAGLLATQAQKWLATGIGEPLADGVLAIDVAAARTQRHPLVRRPQCAECGEPGLRSAGPKVVLGPARKSFTQDGGHRTMSPEDTWAQREHLVSPITGVVTRLLPQAADDDLVFGYLAVHDFPIVRPDAAALGQSLLGHSGGKGASAAQARVSALGEAVERYSTIWRGEEEATVRSSARELGDQAVPLPGCLGFSADQLQNREEWNRTCTDPHQVVPRRFDDDATLDWTALWSLTHEVERYLPSAYCYYGHPDLARFYCFADSNGVAAGNTLEEAVYQGLLELVERDAVGVWWYNRLQRPPLDLAGFGSPYVDDLVGWYARQSRDLWALDLTGDLGIPVVAAVSARTDAPVEDVIIGFGAHLDPTVALLRALTEVNQSSLALTERGADGTTLYRTANRTTLRWLRSATRGNQPFLTPAAGPSRGIRDMPARATDDVGDDVRQCVGVLAKAGLETLVLDLTRPDVEMPVARVVVPGLAHFWRRLGHRRLYEVPVALGWRDRPLAEAAMNPSDIYF